MLSMRKRCAGKFIFIIAPIRPITEFSIFGIYSPPSKVPDPANRQQKKGTWFRGSCKDVSRQKVKMPVVERRNTK